MRICSVKTVKNPDSIRVALTNAKGYKPATAVAPGWPLKVARKRNRLAPCLPHVASGEQEGIRTSLGELLCLIKTLLVGSECASNER